MDSNYRFLKQNDHSAIATDQKTFHIDKIKIKEL